MKEGGFVSFGQFVGVVDLVACVGRGDIKFTHQARHPAEDTGHHLNAFGSVGKAVREWYCLWVCRYFVEEGGKGLPIPKAGVVSSEALNDNHDNIRLYPPAAEGSRHGEGRKGG